MTIGLLLVCIVGITVIRATRTREPTRVALPAVAVRPTPPREDSADNSLERAKRAIAVSAIESGDYQRAVDELTKIVKSGRGVGDEIELLGIAKELQDKSERRAAVPAAGGPLPETKPSVPTVAAAPVVTKTPTPTPTKPAPALVRRPVVVASRAPAPVKPEPEDGQLLVFSVPVGLLVEVDGNEAGVTPVRRTVAAGRHLIVLLKGNTRLADRTVNVTPDEVTTVDFDVREKLMPKEVPVAAPAPEPRPAVATAKPVEQPVVSSAAPAPTSTPVPAPAQSTRPAVDPGPLQTGEVFVSSASLGGVVFINGTSYGSAPLLARSVPVGTALVELKNNGETRRSKEITVSVGERAEVRFR